MKLFIVIIACFIFFYQVYAKELSNVDLDVYLLQPEIYKPVANISAAIGEDVTFTCYVRQLGGYKVAWIKDDTGAILTIDLEINTCNERITASHSSDKSTWNLHIKSVTEDDRGEYSCVINTFDAIMKIGYLDVQGKGVTPEQTNYAGEPVVSD